MPHWRREIPPDDPDKGVRRDSFQVSRVPYPRAPSSGLQRIGGSLLRRRDVEWAPNFLTLYHVIVFGFLLLLHVAPINVLKYYKTWVVYVTYRYVRDELRTEIGSFFSP